MLCFTEINLILKVNYALLMVFHTINDIYNKYCKCKIILGYSNSSQSLTGAQVSQNGINKAREVSYTFIHYIERKHIKRDFRIF